MTDIEQPSHLLPGDLEVDHLEDLDALPPEEPSLPPREWMQKNLFSSFNSGILTVAALWVSLWTTRGLLNFVFSEERSWSAVRFNLRLIMTQAYPSEQYARVWVSVGAILVLAGMSLGLARVGTVFSARRVSTALLAAGGIIAVGIMLRQPGVQLDPEGVPLLQEVPADVGGGTGALGTLTTWLIMGGIGLRLVLAVVTRVVPDLDHQLRQRVAHLSVLLAGVGGALMLLLFVLGPWAFRDDLESPLRESFADAMADRAWWWVLAVVLGALGAAIWFGLGDARRRTTFVPGIYLGFAVTGLLVLSLWVYPWGSYTFSSEGFLADPGSTVSATTKGPWTVVWLLLIAAYAVGRYAVQRPLASTLRIVLAVSWLLSPFFLFWVVLRDPDIDYSHVWSTDLPMALAFIVLGGAIVFGLTRVGIGELGRIIAVGLVGVAALNWIAAFAGWYPMLQKARISFLLLALFALAAPNFASEERRQRLNLVWAWVGAMVLFHYLVTLINSPSTVETPSEGFLGGFGVTLFVAVFTIIFSFPLGVLLALARTSTLPIFRVLSTTYIETIRGIPLITVLFFFANIVNLFLPNGMSLGDLAAVTLGYALFSAAYLAENVRGGLQAVRRGQYEAADALGLTTAQRTSFIILPQALRVSIPPLVGQLIATFKETSLLSIIGVFDMLYIANKAIPAQSEFLGVKREPLLVISVIYWILAFSMSKYSQSLERRLGVGER